MRSSRPSVAELRAVAQPSELIGRRSAEHWAGRLYMRRLSAHVTRRVLPLQVTPNGWTLLMIVVGVAGAAILAVPGLWTALAAAVAIQIYLLLDCVDGEVARWRQQTSAAGVYLDRLGHYTVEAALLAALGVRVDGGYGAIGLGAVVGLAAAVLALLSKAETDLVIVARVSAGLPLDGERDPTPGTSGLRGLRHIFALLPVHRIIGGVELSLLAALTAVIDVAVGAPAASRVLLVAAATTAAIVAVGHPVSVLSSQRLR